MTDPMLEALNGAAESLRVAVHASTGAPSDPDAVYERVGALARVERALEAVITTLAAHARQLANDPPPGFRADDGGDPVTYARSGVDHLMLAAYYRESAVEISDAHNALSHLGAG